MAGHDIIVVGASAGGVEALSELVTHFPADLPAAVFVVLHTNTRSILPHILSRLGKLAATYAQNGEPIEHGHIYVAPPGNHLLIKPGHIHLLHGPKENGHLPAIDPMFRTAAQVYRHRVVGVVLSGALDDGTAGLLAVKRTGGIAMVQDPEEAPFPAMPRSAIEYVQIDHILPVSQIGPALIRLVYESVEEPEGIPAEVAMEPDILELHGTALEKLRSDGPPSIYICPECNGPLWERPTGELIRFQCYTGHTYSPASLVAEEGEKVEKALWNTLQMLMERESLLLELAQRAYKRGNRRMEAEYKEQAGEARRRADHLRQIL
jgi:two-component system chemotaxis response regulator CheB